MPNHTAARRTSYCSNRQSETAKIASITISAAVNSSARRQSGFRFMFPHAAAGTRSAFVDLIISLGTIDHFCSGVAIANLPDPAWQPMLAAQRAPLPRAGRRSKRRLAMLENLAQQPADALLALIKLHNADPRPDKIDLGVGVYRTGQGDTPVFAAIKAAEKVLLETQDSKSYLGPEGDMGFVHALMPYIFGADDPTMGGRIEGMQTPGGTGAVRLAVALAHKAGIGRIALETGATVLPIAIHGSSRVRNWKRLQLPKVTVRYGEPLRFEVVEEPTREQQQAAADEIFGRIKALYAELETQVNG